MGSTAPANSDVWHATLPGPLTITAPDGHQETILVEWSWTFATVGTILFALTRVDSGELLLCVCPTVATAGISSIPRLAAEVFAQVIRPRSIGRAQSSEGY